MTQHSGKDVCNKAVLPTFKPCRSLGLLTSQQFLKNHYGKKVNTVILGKTLDIKIPNWQYANLSWSDTVT